MTDESEKTEEAEDSGLEFWREYFALVLGNGTGTRIEF